MKKFRAVMNIFQKSAYNFSTSGPMALNLVWILCKTSIWCELNIMKDIYHVVLEKISEFKNKERKKYPMSDKVKWKAIKKCLKNTFFLYANNFLRGQGSFFGKKLSKLLSKTTPILSLLETYCRYCQKYQESGLIFV